MFWIECSDIHAFLKGSYHEESHFLWSFEIKELDVHTVHFRTQNVLSSLKIFIETKQQKWLFLTSKTFWSLLCKQKNFTCPITVIFWWSSSNIQLNISNFATKCRCNYPIYCKYKKTVCLTNPRIFCCMYEYLNMQHVKWNNRATTFK